MKRREIISEKVIVAVKAEKTVSKTALLWALTHVAHPGDSITLLAVLSGTKPVNKRWFWSFNKYAVDCQSVDHEKLPARASQISELCSQMVLQLHDQIQVQILVKVVSGTPTGAVAADAKNNSASWVILDKNLQQEQKHCLQELQCNIVAMKGSRPMVLRLNLCSNEPQNSYSAASSPNLFIENSLSHNIKHSTPVSSPENSVSSTKITQENSISSQDIVISPYLVYKKNSLLEGPKKGNYKPSNERKKVFYISQNHSMIEKPPPMGNDQNAPKNNYRICEIDYVHSLSLRHAMSLGENSSIPPPLCSICKHKAPVFGKPPKNFNYEELVEATDGFSDINLFVESEFGKVFRGVLRDGQVVAMKKLNFVGCKRDADFCQEVRVLSYAQHRNVVLMIGFCIEGENRILVYEYICNGSLDSHLHGKKRALLDWQCRQKIAIGVARGLRYLHEDCRVGCITHGDMRPSNILLTHDHEPLVADFGLARLHEDSNIRDEQVFGTIRYLAPECFDYGETNEKVDIYAFGLVLLELITGRKTIDLRLEPAEILVNIFQLIDPCLAPYGFTKLPPEVQTMSDVAFLCLQQDPESRPPMSKVVRILEGADISIALRLDLNSVGNRSGHMKGLRSNTPLETRRHYRNYSH